ncbi:hypothetical protein L7F22_038980 [Adiantum nelumboides]|nr:hypothetical protein [Adiantum nelumboides]
MIEVSFWNVAQKALADAKAEAEKRTQEAKTAIEAATSDVPASKEAGDAHAGDSEGAPNRSSKQLYGNEVVRFQAMRIAYFCLDNRDADLESKRVILNRIVSLKEDAGKN